MKTQLLALESHDDLTSVRDKMSWAKTPRILLIWPKGEAIDLRPLDLKILQRHARSLGATLGLVTRDVHVRREAAALKIPVFSSPRAAQMELWHPSTSPKFHSPRNVQALWVARDVAHPGHGRWQSNPVIRFVFFALGALAVLALALLFLPHAVITLSPESRTQRLTIPVTADPTLKSIVITGGVPAYAGTCEVTGTQQISSTGEMAVPESEARGVARFRNLTSSRIHIPAGTIVQTLGASPITFVTTQSAEIAAGTGKTADVPIQAVGAGARGNLEIDLIQVVEGPLGLSLSVTNPAPTSGGTERMVATPNAGDYERLRRMLMDSLQTQAQLKMLADLPIGSVIFPDTVEEVIVLEEEANPSAGKVGGTLNLRLRVKFKAQYVSGDDLAEFASQVSSASMEDGFAPVVTPPVFRTVGTPVTDDMGRTKFQLQVERRVQRTIDSQLVLSMVQGKSLESALTLLDEVFKLSSPPVIRMTPSWWRWLPLAPFRIDVVIQ